ncbi:MAG: penicillin-binding protein 2 [Chloroflexi bacterium]|nr:penicillin-binding protein 2 [Chloroflexota bacterium]
MPDHGNEYSFTQTITEAEQRPRGNFRILRLSIVAAFLVLASQLAQVQIVQGEYFRNAADQNRFRLLQTDALRGIVYDRTGKILVRNMPSFNVSIVPADLPYDNQDDILRKLSTLLNVPLDTIIQVASADAVGRLPSDMDRTVVPPKRELGLREMVAEGERDPYSPTVVKTNVPRDVAFYLEENHLDFPGVQIGLDPVRQYVDGPLLSNILGYVGHITPDTLDDFVSKGYSPSDQVGLTGLEYAYEQDLHGTKGRRYIEVDVFGREVANLGEQAPVPGHNLVLTIDADFQQKVQDALLKGMKAAHSKQGVAIALDPRNGEILAMVSLPTYDDNLFATGISVADYNNLAQDPLHPMLDQAISGQYPPGSTFKLIPASAALQEHVVDVNTRYETPGTIWVPNQNFPEDLKLAQPFYDWYKPGFGSLNILNAIRESSDVFFYKLAGGEYPSFDTGLGEERLAAYARLFGLGQATGIDLPAEAKALVPDPAWKLKTVGNVWTVGDTYNMGIGQGYVLATPLQVADYTAIVANGGTLYKPELVHAVTDSQGQIVRTIQPQVIRRLPIDQNAFTTVREGMRLGVTSGTSDLVNLADVNVAAKTGTAEYYGPRVDGHLPTHAWFTAFAPYEDPQIVVTVFIYGGGEGSAVAAPVAADILRDYFQLPSNSPLVSAPPSLAPPVVVHPEGSGSAAPAHKYAGRLLGTDGWQDEPPGIFGTVVDVNGRGVTGVRVVADKCDNNTVFGATTDANGAFSFNAVYWKDSSRWCVRTVAPSDSDPFAIDVQPYNRYTIQFVPTE